MFWSHYCTLNQEGEVVDRGRFRTTPKAIEKWFTDLPPARIAMEAGTHSIWISEQLQELGHEVIVANVRELRAISHSDRKSDHADAEKLARFARLDPQILRPIPHSPTAGSPYADQSSRFQGPTSHCGSERSSWTNEGPAATGCRLPRRGVSPSAAWPLCHRGWHKHSARYSNKSRR
jgi:hypothetical protein